MSGNKYLLPDKGSLLQTKLRNLATNLELASSATHFQTQEEYLFETAKVLKEFYKDMGAPQLASSQEVHADDLPSFTQYNDTFLRLLNDLTTIFAELENVEAWTVNSFNFITTESNRLRTRIKTVSSKIGDFTLYSLNALKDVLVFKDSFNDLSKIDFNSALLNTPQAEINQEEGILTLPINQELSKIVTVAEAPIIDKNSNGEAGNNHEIGAAHHGDISVILDNNADTWFEYERVVTSTSNNQEALVLGLTINLGPETIINSITVNPNNFGTRTAIIIDTIDTSLDGNVYTSIKDDIPIAGFSTADEENVFLLAPSTSKYAGQGIYSFTPRKVKYIRFRFKQSEPYIIQTTTGNKLRYAIGIRDIKIQTNVFNPIGEVISQSFVSTDEIRKAFLDSNQNPSDFSELASINWSLSLDNGSSWHAIQPKQFTVNSGQTAQAPEVLNFNGPESNAIQTPTPVKNVRLKIHLERNNDAFQRGSSSLIKKLVNTSELHNVPTQRPFTLNLEHSPILNTIDLIDASFGSRGFKEDQYTVASRINGQQLFVLPDMFKQLIFKWPQEKVLQQNGQYSTRRITSDNWVHVSVGGEEWSHVISGFDQYVYDPNNIGNSKVYKLNLQNNTLSFTSDVSNVVSDNASVMLYFEPERITPNELTNNHIAELIFPTASTKDTITVERFDEPEIAAEALPKGATVIHLANENITDDGVTLIDDMLQDILGFVRRKEFLNGTDEIELATDYSIDTEHGIIYLGTPTPEDDDVTLNYVFQPKYELTVDDWDWVQVGPIRNQIAIKDTAWKTRQIKQLSLTVPQQTQAIHLPHLSLVKGTFIPYVTGSDLTDNNNPFLKETEFSNGSFEFMAFPVKKISETIPQLVPSGSNIASFNLRHPITTSSNHALTFTNGTYFSTEVGSYATLQASAVGSYWVNRSGSSVYVKLPSSASVLDTQEKVTYWFDTPNTKDNGLYSIDYPNGIVYLQRRFDPNVGNWTLKVDYQYTHYEVKYRIARRVDQKDYTVDITNNRLLLKEYEVLKHFATPRPTRDIITPYYLVNYDYVSEARENVEELAPYFTPIVKDYLLKLLPKGKLL